jgi:hypothetical protein
VSTTLARIEPAQIPLHDGLRNFKVRLREFDGTAPVQALTEFAAQTLEHGDLAQTRRTLGAVYSQHYESVPPSMRQELDILANKIEQAAAARRRRANPSQGAAPRQQDGVPSTHSGPGGVGSTPSPPLHQDYGGTPGVPLGGHPLVAASVPRPVLHQQPEPRRSSAAAPLLLFGALALGLGAAHWSDKGRR